MQIDLALRYYGFTADESGSKGRGALVLALGQLLMEAVEQGFIASVEKKSAPTLREIAITSGANEVYVNWYVFLAGMDLLWVRDGLRGRSTASLTAGYALSLLLDTFDGTGEHAPGYERDWSRWILNNRQDIARRVCEVLSHEWLRQGREIAPLLRSAANLSAPQWLAVLALRILARNQRKTTSDLEHLCLVVAASDENRGKLEKLTRKLTSARTATRASERTFWVILNFLQRDKTSAQKLAKIAAKNPGSIWIITAISQPLGHRTSQNGQFELDLPQMEFIVQTYGSLFPNVESVGGWGDKSGADAARYLRGLVLNPAHSGLH